MLKQMDIPEETLFLICSHCDIPSLYNLLCTCKSIRSHKHIIWKGRYSTYNTDGKVVFKWIKRRYIDLLCCHLDSSKVIKDLLLIDCIKLGHPELLKRAEKKRINYVFGFGRPTLISFIDSIIINNRIDICQYIVNMKDRRHLGQALLESIIINRKGKEFQKIAFTIICHHRIKSGRSRIGNMYKIARGLQKIGYTDCIDVMAEKGMITCDELKQIRIDNDKRIFVDRSIVIVFILVLIYNFLY